MEKYRQGPNQLTILLMGDIRKILVSFLYKHYIVTESIKKQTTIRMMLLAIIVRERHNSEGK